MIRHRSAAAARLRLKQVSKGLRSDRDLHTSKPIYASAPLPAPLRHPVASTSASGSATTVTLPASRNLRGFGQALPSTHPHLLKHGELTEGIPASEYADRRKRLMDSLPEKSVVVLPGARLQYSSGSIFYKFRQASDFFYLSGWLEHDAALILEKTSDSKGYKMTFFCQSRDPERELWEGPRNGPNTSVDVFGADEALDIAQFTSHLKSLLSSSNTAGPIYVDLPDSPLLPTRAPRGAKPAKSIINFLTGAASGARRTALDLGLSSKKSDYDSVVSLLSSPTGGRTIRSLALETERLRVIKSDNEIKLMRRAGAISGDAHAEVMKLATADGKMGEHQLVSHFEYSCAMRGSTRLAYIPVCAAGANATYLHYTANSALLQKDDLVLIDAGCEYAGYASDVTRTFPVSGRFTEPQKDLYTAVLRSMRSCIRLCTEKSGVNLYDLHEKSRATLVEELRQIGLDLREKLDLLDQIYAHFVGHPLGIDLHDAPTFQRHTRLDAGNVITIEPGVIMPDHPDIPEHFRGLAIRLEDEILVGKEEPVILSVEAPIEIADVEACCQRLLDSSHAATR